MGQYRLRVGQEEAGVEPPRPVWRGNGSGHEGELGQLRPVSRVAASANARGGRRTIPPFLRSASVSGVSSWAAGARASPGSTRPPGKTHLSGMKTWPLARWPIITSRRPRTRMRVAASRGRAALGFAPSDASNGFSSGLRRNSGVDFIAATLAHDRVLLGSAMRRAYRCVNMGRR
jgi:hypothetical protein